MEQNAYPWQLTDKDLSSLGGNAPAKASEIPLTQTLLRYSLLGFGGLFLATGWLITQAWFLDVDYVAQVKDFPKIPKNQIAIVPPPVRYDLMQTPPAMDSSIAMEPGMVPVNYSGSIPAELSNIALTAPLPPAEPSFNLVGIALGDDGTVATLKVTDELSGLRDEMKDVHKGSTLLNGYTVSEITSDYVLIKNKGKTIRVE